MKTTNKKLVITLCLIFSLIFIQRVSAQTQKGNWLIGGSGSFTSNNHKMSSFPSNEGSTSTNSKTSSLLLNGNIGYFVKDRFAIGISPNIHLWNMKDTYANYPYLNSSSNGSSIGLGLFTRYYFLNNQEKFNFIGEASYGFDKVTDEDAYQKKTSISIGPVLFLNSNTSLDFLLNYSNSNKNYTRNKVTDNSISLNIGLQIYLN